MGLAPDPAGSSGTIKVDVRGLRGAAQAIGGIQRGVAGVTDDLVGPAATVLQQLPDGAAADAYRLAWRTWASLLENTWALLGAIHTQTARTAGVYEHVDQIGAPAGRFAQREDAT